MGRSRATLIDQVDSPGEGLPFYTEKTLNPVWNQNAAIVRMPESAWTDQNGNVRDENLFAGKKTVVAFAFTSCSGFCPFVIQELKKVEAANAKVKDLQFVVFTVDPELDSSKRLKDFAKSHDVDREHWYFLRGTVPQTVALIRDTFASQLIQKDLAKGRDFVHSGHLYLFDQNSRLRGIMNGTELSVAAKSRRSIEALQ